MPSEGDSHVLDEDSVQNWNPPTGGEWSAFNNNTNKTVGNNPNGGSDYGIICSAKNSYTNDKVFLSCGSRAMSGYTEYWTSDSPSGWYVNYMKMEYQYSSVNSFSIETRGMESHNKRVRLVLRN